MEDKECRWCLHFNGGNCSKLNEEIEHDTNLVNLVEDGELTEYLRENLSDRIESLVSDEDNVEEVMQLFTDEVYSFFLDRLEVSVKIPTCSDFYCKDWR